MALMAAAYRASTTCLLTLSVGVISSVRCSVAGEMGAAAETTSLAS